MANLIYDNFPGAGPSVDTDKWVVFTGGGTVTQSTGQVLINAPGSWDVTGLISKKAFSKSDIRLTCSGGANCLAGLQPQNTSLVLLSNGITIDINFQGGGTFYAQVSGIINDTGYAWVAGVHYEIDFKISGTDVNVYVTGGAYVTPQLIYSASGIMTSPSYYAVLEDSGSGTGLYCYSVSEDLGHTTYFGSPSVSDGTAVGSIVDRNSIVSVIQAIGSDVYFDTTSEISRVDAYYEHTGGRQGNRIIHRYPGFVGNVTWSPFARDGTWQKTQVVAYDFEGATATIPRAYLTAEDLTHSDGTMNLNT